MTSAPLDGPVGFETTLPAPSTEMVSYPASPPSTLATLPPWTTNVS